MVKRAPTALQFRVIYNYGQNDLGTIDGGIISAMTFRAGIYQNAPKKIEPPNSGQWRNRYYFPGNNADGGGGKSLASRSGNVSADEAHQTHIALRGVGAVEDIMRHKELFPMNVPV